MNSESWRKRLRGSRERATATGCQKRATGAIVLPTHVGADAEVSSMCRNIKILFNFEPPVTEGEIHAAALQYVRKVSGFNKPSAANELAFQTAIEEIAAASSRLLHSLQTNAPAKNREEEAAKARARNAERFSQ